MKIPTTLFFAAMVATVSAQWELVTPIKATSEFQDIHLVNDQVGYALDRTMGAILRTDDGGFHWTRLANNISSQPRAMFMWDELRGIVVSGSGTIIRTTDGFNTFNNSLNPTFGGLTCVFFVNDTLGWIGTNTGKIYRSIDAGATWSLMASGQPTNNYMTSIQFVDTQVGYASCAGGEMLKSTDGGLTWQGVGPFDQLVLIQDIHFYNADLGVGVGNAGEVIRTTDGGVTWDSIPTNITYSMLDLDVQGDTMVACGAWGRILRSTDAGLTWTVIQMGNSDHQSVSLTPSGAALLGTNGRIHRSSDMGATWEVAVEGVWSTQVLKMSFMDADTGVAIGWQSSGGNTSGLMRTTDGGRHWVKAGGGGLGIHLTPDGFGCLGGSSGAFARTTNSFITRSSPSGPNVAIRCTWSFDANTHIVAGGYVNGGIYRTTNGGSSWTFVLDAGNLSIYDLWFVDDLQGYAMGEGGGNYRTYDGGVTWEAMTPISPSGTVFFLNAQLGWTGNFRTTDGGDTWTAMGGTPQQTSSIFFTSPDTGYAVSYTGQTVRSLDGGVTWENLLADILNASVGDAAFVDGYIVIGCNNGDIFRAQVACPSVAAVPMVTLTGQSLCTSLAGTVQWYLDGEVIDGATTNCYEAEQGGMYTVIVTDVFGCTSATSQPVQVLITGVDEASNKAMTLSPNPTNSLVQMERRSDLPATVFVIDAQGRLMVQQRIAGTRVLLDLSGLNAGAYMVRVIDREGVSTAHVVKQ